MNTIENILEKSKKMEICDSLNAHDLNEDHICKSCGMLIEKDERIRASNALFETIFYKLTRNLSINNIIKRMYYNIELKDFSITKYIEIGKYLIDNMPKTNTQQYVNAAAIFGYIPQNIAQRISNVQSLVNKLLLTRHTIQYFTSCDNFNFRCYDKEQIDELFCAAPNILTPYKFIGAISIDDHYLSLKASQAYNNKQFDTLRRILSIFVNPYLFKSVDSRFIPFITVDSAASIKEKHMVANYKNELFNNLKYLNTDNADANTARAIIQISNYQQKPNQKNSTVHFTANVQTKKLSYICE